jgi:hypothetical protein
MVRSIYFKRLDVILSALDTPGLKREARLSLQTKLWRGDWLRRFDPKRVGGIDAEGNVVITLRLIAESTNGIEVLTPQIIAAVSACLHEAWARRGLELFAAMDRVPLLHTEDILRSFGLEVHLPEATRFRLTQILGSPHAAPQPEPKKAARKNVPRNNSMERRRWRRRWRGFKREIKRPSPLAIRASAFVEQRVLKDLWLSATGAVLNGGRRSREAMDRSVIRSV